MPEARDNNSMSRIETGKRPEIWSPEKAEKRMSEATPVEGRIDVGDRTPGDNDSPIAGLHITGERESSLLSQAKDILGTEGDLTKEEQDRLRMAMLGIALANTEILPEKSRVIKETLTGLSGEVERLDEINRRVAAELGQREDGIDWEEQFSFRTKIDEGGNEAIEVVRPRSSDEIVEIVGETIMEVVAEGVGDEEGREHLNLNPIERRQLAEAYLKADWRNLQTEFRTAGLSDRPIQVILEMNKEEGERGGARDDLTAEVNRVKAGGATFSRGTQAALDKLLTVASRSIPGLENEQLKAINRWISDNYSNVEIPIEVMNRAAAAKSELEATVTAARAAGGGERQLRKELPENDETMALVRDVMKDMLLGMEDVGQLRSKPHLWSLVINQLASREGVVSIKIPFTFETELRRELAARAELRAVEVFWTNARRMENPEEVLTRDVIPVISEDTYHWLCHQETYVGHRDDGRLETDIDLTGDISKSLGIVMGRIILDGHRTVVGKDLKDRIRAPLGYNIQGDKISFWLAREANKGNYIEEIANSSGVDQDAVRLAWSLIEAECWAAGFDKTHPVFKVARFSAFRAAQYLSNLPVPGGKRLAEQWRTMFGGRYPDDATDAEAVAQGMSSFSHAFDVEGTTWTRTGLDFMEKYLRNHGDADTDVIDVVLSGGYMDLLRRVREEPMRRVTYDGDNKRIKEIWETALGFQPIMRDDIRKGFALTEVLDGVSGKEEAKKQSAAKLDAVKGKMFTVFLQMGYDIDEVFPVVGSLLNEWARTYFWRASWANPDLRTDADAYKIFDGSEMVDDFRDIITSYDKDNDWGLLIGFNMTMPVNKVAAVRVYTRLGVIPPLTPDEIDDRIKVLGKYSKDVARVTARQEAVAFYEWFATFVDDLRFGYMPARKSMPNDRRIADDDGLARFKRSFYTGKDPLTVLHTKGPGDRWWLRPARKDLSEADTKTAAEMWERIARI